MTQININNTKLVTYKIRPETQQQSIMIAFRRDLQSKGLLGNTSGISTAKLSGIKVSGWLKKQF